MKAYRLKNEERAGIGFTDLFVVTRADLTTAVNNTPQSIVLTALAVGDLVMNNTLLEVKVNATVLATATGSVGVTSAVAQLVAASNLLAAGDEFYSVAAGVAPYATIAAVNLLFTAVPGAAEALSAMGAGEFWIWATINRKAERNVQV
jgi:hypothetical protein